METIDWRNDAAVQDAVRNAFEGAAPERSAETRDLWATYQLRFNVLPDEGPDGAMVMDAGQYKDIRFNHRVMRAFWLASFAAYSAYREVADSLVQQRLRDLREVNAILQCIAEMIASKSVDVAPLPFGIPEPGTFPDKEKNPEYRACAELAVIAVSWALLHEVRHIQHQQLGTASAEMEGEAARHEEIDCDRYATKFLTDTIDEYARLKNVSAASVALKRMMAIYFAMFAMVVIMKDRWDGAESHPSMQERIDAVFNIFQPRPGDPATLAALMAFAGLWEIWPSAPGVLKAL